MWIIKLRFSLLTLLFIAVMSGCVGTIEPGEPLGAGADNEMPGPGIFSGESGVFIIGGDGKKSGQKISTVKQDLSKQNLQATSDLLDQKIKLLEQQQKELEQLKLEVRKKIEN